MKTKAKKNEYNSNYFLCKVKPYHDFVFNFSEFKTPLTTRNKPVSEYHWDLLFFVSVRIISLETNEVKQNKVGREQMKSVQSKSVNKANEGINVEIKMEIILNVFVKT